MPGASGRLPNIVWLDSEDLSPDLGCYGNPLVHTPNLDRLASEGLRFERAYTTAPVCSASRSAIFTGCHQTTIGMHNHRDISRFREGRSSPLPEGVRHLSEYLREAGYFTCCGHAMDTSRQGKLDYNFEMTFEEAFDGTDWNERGVGQPFFAEMHFTEVHREFKNDPRRPIDADEVEVPPFYPDHPITRLDWALYLETIQVLDRKVGKVLERLDEEGLAENTYVFFTGDHGRPMLRGKQWLYEGGIRIPLLVRGPEGMEPGTVRQDLVSAIDLTTTWLRLAGVEPPDHMPGRNLLGRTAEPDYLFAARDRCDETDFRIRCALDGRYKYIRNFYPERPFTQYNAYKKKQYPVLTLMEMLHEEGELEPPQKRLMAPYRPAEEFYDLQEDPHEINNLVAEPGHRHVLRRMRRRLDEWVCESGDRGRIPEDPADTRFVDEACREKFARDMRDRGLEPDISNEEYLAWWKDRLETTKVRT